MKALLVSVLVLHVTAQNPVVALQACNATEQSQGWEWNENGFLIHRLTGFVIYASGTQQDTDPKPVTLVKTPMLNPAQWLVDGKSAQMHAFRGHGNRFVTDFDRFWSLALLSIPG
jgi:hypothetical protein